MKKNIETSLQVCLGSWCTAFLKGVVIDSLHWFLCHVTLNVGNLDIPSPVRSPSGQGVYNKYIILKLSFNYLMRNGDICYKDRSSSRIWTQEFFVCLFFFSFLMLASSLVPCPPMYHHVWEGMFECMYVVRYVEAYAHGSLRLTSDIIQGLSSTVSVWGRVSHLNPELLDMAGLANQLAVDGSQLF